MCDKHDGFTRDFKFCDVHEIDLKINKLTGKTFIFENTLSDQLRDFLAEEYKDKIDRVLFENTYYFMIERLNDEESVYKLLPYSEDEEQDSSASVENSNREDSQDKGNANRTNQKTDTTNTVLSNG